MSIDILIKKIIDLNMNKFLSITIIYLSFWTSAMGVTVNCLGGKCNFINSYNYKQATTNCQQTLNYEEVETNFLYFIILVINFFNLS